MFFLKKTYSETIIRKCCYEKCFSFRPSFTCFAILHKINSCSEPFVKILYSCLNIFFPGGFNAVFEPVFIHCVWCGLGNIIL